MTEALKIENLHVEADGENILQGVDFEIEQGEVVAMMGPNGSGKSTLAKVLMGHPDYNVIEGEAYYREKNLFELDPDERAHLGLFMAFQYPKEITGVTVNDLLRAAVEGRTGEEIDPVDFRQELEEKMEKLDINTDFADRYVNEGFSGGEKKRLEVLQMAVIEPEIALIDEVDSGLDIDAVSVVANGIQELATPDRGIMLITHYRRILDYIDYDRVAVMIDGKIAKQGGEEVVERLEDEGYDWLKKAA